MVLGFAEDGASCFAVTHPTMRVAVDRNLQ
jgi:hypothetical protein